MQVISVTSTTPSKGSSPSRCAHLGSVYRQGKAGRRSVDRHSYTCTDLTLWMMDNYEPKSVTGVTFEKLGKYLGPTSREHNGCWDLKALKWRIPHLGL